MLPTANAQTVTGSLTGTVADSAGAVVAGATVQLTNEITKQVREFKTQGNGSFTFPDLVPADYDLKVTQPGFKTYIQNGITVGTLEKVAVHTIRLEVGDVATSVEVKAEAARVVTDSSDHSTDVNLKMIEQTPIRGRNFQAIVKDLPGVIDLNSYDTRGWGSGTPTINGGQQGQVLVSLDGIAAQDSGAPGLNTYQAPSTDAIGEVKLLVGNYSAEYGARNGGQMNITIKNGTAQFHGCAYYYFRHEELDANEWFNNATHVVKPRYRYQNPGGTIGGPLIIPGVRFNKDRNRLFFFFSYDYLHNNGSTPVNRYTMPTAAERMGDFSQSFNTNGSPILVRDPNSGATCSAANTAGCFPGNRIPMSRFSPIGAAMLNLFPLPNATDPSGTRQYNFQDQLGNTNPRSDKILRVDYNASSKDTMFVRLLQDYQAQSGYGAILGALGDGWGQFPHSYFIPSAGAAGTYVHTFRPNLINELSMGINKAHQQNMPTDPSLYSASQLPLKSGGQTLGLPTIFPASANYLNLLPAVNFGLPSGFSATSAPTGIPNLPQFGFDSRWPFDGTDSLTTITDNITWIKGSHSIKAGFYFEHDARNVSVYSVYNTAGTYYFGSDLGNPTDTGDPFSNALVGSLYGYGQDNVKQINRARYKQVEWFLQDTWKVNRRLTVDAGLRFQILGALYGAGEALGVFDGKSYSPSQQGQLLFPYCTTAVASNASCPAGSKGSINPATGATYAYARQGTFDPATYSANGTPFSGIQTSNDFFKTPPLQYGPRVGFAYDVFGDGKMAIRGGFGIFYGRAFGVDTIGATGTGIGPIGDAAALPGSDRSQHDHLEPVQLATGIYSSDDGRRTAEISAALDV
ncbi:MAG TPA: carboxypeptidase regulatory-like domain-containing protein [Bryobacteraceae bacterium]|nr:carboxypeptidase regulatory-like domain-containing protein [Bryobacteraceae bacterium]